MYIKHNFLIHTVLCLFMVFLCNVAMAGGTPDPGTSTSQNSNKPTQLLGSTSTVTPIATGDYVQGDGAGANSVWRYYIEVTPGQANLTVDLYDADVGAGDPTGLGVLPGIGNNVDTTPEVDFHETTNNLGWGSTATYTLIDPAGATVATLTIDEDTVSDPANNGTALSFDNTWKTPNGFSIANPVNGHWELTYSLVGGADTVTNNYGLRAHDGVADAGGTEFNVYAESYTPSGFAGIARDAVFTEANDSTYYPYVTSGCSLRYNNFDGDSQGTYSILSRLGQSLANNLNVGGNNAWTSHTAAPANTSTSATDYGLYELFIDTALIPGAGVNLMTNYIGSELSPTPGDNLPQPIPNAYRQYLPADGSSYINGAGTIVAPTLPYVVHSYSQAGNVVTVTVEAVNPARPNGSASLPIEFSAATTGANVITSSVLDNGGATTLQAGSAIASQGLTSIAGNTITWAPGTVAGNTTATLTFEILLDPSFGAGPYTIVDSTSASFVDQTCASQACTGSTLTRATIDFGPLCPLGDALAQTTPELSIDKTSSANGGPVSPGDTITYTIEVENIGSGITTDVEVVDTLPAGVSYVPQSTEVNGFQAIGPNTQTEDFEAGNGGWVNSGNCSTGAFTAIDPVATSWQLEDDHTAGGVNALITAQNPAGADGTDDVDGGTCTTTSPVYPVSAVESGTASIWYFFGQRDAGDNANDGFLLEFSSDSGATWSPIVTVGDVTTTPIWTEATASVPVGSTGISFRVSASNPGVDIVEAGVDDIEIITSAVTPVVLDNDGSATPNPELDNGVPPSIVTAADNLALDSGQIMTITFDVTVDDPLDSAITQLLNTAEATSLEVTTPVTDTAIDTVAQNNLGSIGDTIFNDLDGDGVFDAGEGIAGVDVTLTGTDIDGNTVNVTVTTAGDGQYLFTDVPQSNATGYTVTVDETDLPVTLQGNNTIDPDGGTESESVVVLAAGEDNLDQDFGYQAMGNITGNVKEDTTGDGSGDTDLSAVTVELIQQAEVIDSLIDINGDGVVDASDNGFFAGVPVINGRPDINRDGITNGADDGTIGGITVINGRMDMDGNGSVNPTNRPNDDGTLTVVIDTTMTDGTGDYSFNDVLLGDYLVVETNLTGYTDVSDQDASNDGDAGDSDMTVDSLIAVTLDASDFDAGSGTVTDADNNFVDEQPSLVGSIGDFVWNDADGDGVQDVGEQGINGVTVNLLDSSGSVIATMTTTNHPTTGEPGYYLFSGLSAGDYEVEFTSPTGFTFSPSSQTTDDLDSDVDATGRTGVFTLAQGENNTDVDAGMVPGGSIGDHVWLDTDGDGVDDNGEQGIPGVTIDLLDSGSNVIATTTTDANGDYLFDNLPPGDYTVQVTDTNNKLTDLTESPGNAGGTEAVTLAANQDFLDADFGYVPTAGMAVIGDTVWNDVDGDGIQDPEEVGIPGVTLDLIDGAGMVVDTVTTDANGNYLFTNVAPGDYTVVVTDTGGVITDPAANVTSGPQSPGSVISDPITVLADDIYVDADFGFTAQTGSTLADRVWYDANGDGVQDTGEPGISGVTIDLLDSSGNIIASVVTDANGDFQFTGLPDGDYSIVITDDAGELTGYFSTTPPAAALRQEITTLNGDIVNQDATQASPVTTGSGNGHPSFGFNQPGSIGDTIWNDANGDGIQDPGEGGIAGVTVTLTDSTGAEVDTATTDANGEYLFTNVPAGSNYAVTVDSNNFSGGGALEGYTQTYDADDGTAAADNQSVLSLVDGESNLVQDFGYQNMALPDISGTVFYDVDTDGTHEPDGNDSVPGNSDDEEGIAGVTIDLVDDNGNVVATTVTDANGDYTFPDVPPADYTVAVTDTNGVLDGYTLTSGLDVLPVSETDLNAGDVTDVDFGYVDDEQTAAITSGVWIDTDGDGEHDPDETPVPGVSIDLIDCGADGICGDPTNPTDPAGLDDTVVGTAITDANGDVVFPDLSPGNYQLDMDEGTLPTGLEEIDQAYVANDPNDPISLSEGETYDADFGVEPTPGLAGLSGTLWNDSNPDGSDGDGVQDASEVGLSGIPVSLVNIDTGVTQVVLTNPDGSYVFSGLTPCAGTDPCYTVTYDMDAVNLLGLNGDEPTNTEDLGGPDGSTTPDGINDAVYVVNLQADEFKEDHNFGFDAPVNTFGALEGTVYYEPAPADGELTPATDSGIESVTVNLVDASSNVVSTTTTSDGFTDVDGDGVIDPVGYYKFDNLPVNEDYQVVVTDKNNTTIGFNPSGDPDEAGAVCTVCDEQSELVTIVASDSDGTVNTPAQNFGYMGEQNLGNIGSLIWLDIDNDGVFEPEIGDVGLAGITVECWVNVSGGIELYINGENNLVRTVKTDQNGEYYCEGLPTGSYFVRVTDTSDVLSGFVTATVLGGSGTYSHGIGPDDDDQTNKMKILDANGKPDATLSGQVSMAWYIELGSDNFTADFAVSGSNEISGHVFEEAAGATPDATLDGTNDIGIGGVTVILYREQPDGTFVELMMTTTSDGTATEADGTTLIPLGGYVFEGLPDGNYQIVVDTGGSSIDGYGQTADPDLPVGEVCDSPTAALCDDATGSVGATSTLNLSLNNGNPVVTDVDFGYQTNFVTTPITLGYFHAERGVNAGEVTIRWQTVTESGNVGFNLYGKARGKHSAWQKLNADLIVSPVGDSVEVQAYEYLSVGPVVSRFAIGDIDIFGKETIRGPFKLGKEYGANRSDRKKTNWTTIRKQTKANKAARKAKREARRAKRMKRLEKQLDRDEKQMRRQLKRQQRMEQKAHNQNGVPVSLLDSSSSWRSRLLGALLLALVPSAHANGEFDPVTDPGLVYFHTDEAGIYRVTYEELLAHGVDLSGVKHARLALMHAGEPVSVRSKGQTTSDRKQRKYFGPGGWIEFVAEDSESIYTDKLVYGLYEDVTKRKTVVYDKRNPNRIQGPLTMSYTSTVEMDYDVFYSPAASVSDPWYARRLVSTKNGPVSILFPIQVDHILPGPVSVSASVWGGFVGDHHVDVQLNDYAVGSASFSGFTSQTITGETTTAALLEGLNRVKVTVTNTPDQVADIVHTDTWSVSYPRELIVDSDSEQLIFSAQGSRFQVQGYEAVETEVLNRRVYRKRSDGELESLTKVRMPSNRDGTYGLRFAGEQSESSTYYVSLEGGLKQVELVDPVEQEDLLEGVAQYVVISHPDFIDEHMEELISAREGQGYSTKVVDVEAVYSAFGYGHFGAQAIQRYIAWLYANLDTEMVLLVGADTYDYHDNSNTGSMSFLPSLYVQTSDRIYHAPSDSKYADIDGDNIPDLSIGRMIPRTTQEWSNSVSKTLQYAFHPNPRSLVLAVDEQDQGTGYSFSLDADETIASLPALWQQGITRAYIDEIGLGAARSTLIEALNSGQAVAGMFGHSGPRDWTFQGLFKSEDAASLTNAGSPTVITQWGCWNTYYVHPSEDTLAHEFMLNDLNGAAAVLGASTLTEADHEREMAKQVYPRMFTLGKPLGEAILEAKQAHAQNYSNELDVILGWNLLGDPALVVGPDG